MAVRSVHVTPPGPSQTTDDAEFVCGDVAWSATHVRHWPAAGGANHLGERRQNRA
jgi:hypothetical protein